MHVIFWSIISSSWNSCIGTSLSISSFSFHAFIISYDSNFASSLMCFYNFPGEIIIGERENAKINRFLSHSNIFTKSSNVRFTWEEESILELSFWSEKIVLKFLNHLSESFYNFFVSISLHLGHGNFESLRNSIVTCLLLESVWSHLSNNSRKIIEINFGLLKILILAVHFLHLSVTFLYVGFHSKRFFVLFLKDKLQNLDKRKAFKSKIRII